jgi:hypothetical protein
MPLPPKPSSATVALQPRPRPLYPLPYPVPYDETDAKDVEEQFARARRRLEEMSCQKNLNQVVWYMCWFVGLPNILYDRIAEGELVLEVCWLPYRHIAI